MILDPATKWEEMLMEPLDARTFNPIDSALGLRRGWPRIARLPTEHPHWPPSSVQDSG